MHKNYCCMPHASPDVGMPSLITRLTSGGKLILGRLVVGGYSRKILFPKTDSYALSAVLCYVLKDLIFIFSNVSFLNILSTVKKLSFFPFISINAQNCLHFLSLKLSIWVVIAYLNRQNKMCLIHDHRKF